MMIRTKIISTGGYVPKKVVTNHDLEKMMETSDEWIQQRSGIKERRWIQPGDSSLSMAKAATDQALQKANLKPDDIDAIIYGCLISDYVFPGGGCLLQKELGIKKPIPALDIRNQCSAFLYSLSVADAWIRSGMYKTILIVGSEIHSTSLDVTTRGRDVSVLFGDGAGVVIVQAQETNDPKVGVQDIIIASEGENAEKLFLKEPSPTNFPRLKLEQTFTPDIYPTMDGRFVFKNAIHRMTESLMQVLSRQGLKPSDIDFVVAHQANMRINQMVMEQLGLPESKTHHTIDRYGNTTAATIPLTLNEAIELKKIKPGSLVALTAFGSGFTWGSALVRM